MAVIAHAANKTNPDTHHIMTSIDFASQRSIGLTQHVISQLYLLPESSRLARITQVHRGSVAIHDGCQELTARALPHLAQQLVVGDWVGASAESNGDCWIAERLEPLTQIARRTEGRLSQALVSNVDTALLVMGLDNDFNPRRLERYIAMVQVAGVAPVVVLTKADISDDVDGQLALLRQRLPASLPMVAVDARRPEGLEAWLGAGQTLVLLGTSGAGKSTLTNALSGSDQQTGGLRHGDGRGRHTTTARSLHRCTDGACIIDTPGLRSWRPDADEETLAASFDDIAELAAQCQFRDCQHEAEPGCAVRDAVDADRLLNYHKLMREARRATQTPQDRINERARWKVMMKAGKERGRAKKGM
jgi:ribosome biogenesis GTPase